MLTPLSILGRMHITSTPRRLAALLAAVLVALLTLTGCDPGEGTYIGPVPPSTPGPRIAMVGDSLVDCCDEAWVAGELGQRYPLALFTVGATRLGPNQARWFDTLDPQPTVAIVAMGTNNARDGWGTDDQAWLGQVVTALADVPCVVFVNMGYGPGTAAGPTYRQGVADGNAAYAAVAAADPTRVKVTNWRGWSSYAPTWFDTDGIHHSPQGKVQYQSLITGTTKAHLATGRCG